MPPPTRAELLAYIARHEGLERTLQQFPSVTREHLRALLREAALLMRAEEAGVPEVAAPAPPGRGAAGGAQARATPAGPAPAPPAPAGTGEVGRGRTPAAEHRPTAREARPDAAGARPPADAPARSDPGADEAAAPPARGRRLRLFSDGAARGNPGPAGAGAVLLKADGTVVARLGKFLGPQTNNYAEYMALLLGLESALRLGADEIEVRADSELLVRQLLGVYKVKNAGLKPLFERARALLARFRKVDLAHVPREQNREADEMSNRAIDERM